MVTTSTEDIVYGLRYSSVVPAGVTGEDMAHHLTNMDLMMKLHYLRSVYFFHKNAIQGLTIAHLKEPMFKWLEVYYISTGRIRRSDSGRPYIKCNDSGVRIIEGQCDYTIDEWLQMEKKDSSSSSSSLHKHLVSNQVLGPELAFSPLVLIQFTWFKCGGLSMGLSWAHILGDAFSASNFVDLWGQIMAENLPTKQLNLRPSQPKISKSQSPPSIDADPLSVKRVEPLGDHWITAPNSKMGTFTFHITAMQLNNLQSKTSSGQSLTGQTPPFEAISSIIWQCLARIKEEGLEPRMVTICRNKSGGKENGLFFNNQTISVVKADFSIVGADPAQLADLITNQSMDETTHIEETMERDQGLTDFVVYGVNLTFVDLQEVELYGLKVQGHRPIFVNYSIDGVGDEGVVLVLPGPEKVNKDADEGRTVTVILPENQVSQLKIQLKNNGLLFV